MDIQKSVMFDEWIVWYGERGADPMVRFPTKEDAELFVWAKGGKVIRTPGGLIDRIDSAVQDMVTTAFEQGMEAGEQRSAS